MNKFNQVSKNFDFFEEGVEITNIPSFHPGLPGRMDGEFDH